MTTVGPVCHIPPASNAEQPTPSNLPNIPPAQPNLASLTATVNAMRQAVIILNGQQGVQGPRGAAGAGGLLKTPQWAEKSRITDNVKVYNPDDKTQFIEVERINRLVMEDKNNKQTWQWDRGGE